MNPMMDSAEAGFQPSYDKSAKAPPRKNTAGERAHTTIQNLFTIIAEQEMDIEKLR